MLGFNFGLPRSRTRSEFAATSINADTDYIGETALVLPDIPLRKILIAFLLLLFAPIAASAARYFWLGDGRVNWQTADRSSAGLLPPAPSNPDAAVRVFAARTVRWRSIFAVHTWIVVKEKGARTYTRYDYTAWGEPIRTNGFAPDGRWFGAMPETIVAVDGKRAEALIPKIRYVIENYKFRSYGDYSAWPGPNSNTFVQAALDSVPELRAVLPPTAMGKDYPYDGRWFVSLRPVPASSSRSVATSD